MSSCPPHSAEISAPEMSSSPLRLASSRASGRPGQGVVVGQGEARDPGLGHPARPAPRARRFRRRRSSGSGGRSSSGGILAESAVAALRRAAQTLLQIRLAASGPQGDRPRSCTRSRACWSSPAPTPSRSARTSMRARAILTYEGDLAEAVRTGELRKVPGHRRHDLRQRRVAPDDRASSPSTTSFARRFHQACGTASACPAARRQEGQDAVRDAGRRLARRAGARLPGRAPDRRPRLRAQERRSTS